MRKQMIDSDRANASAAKWLDLRCATADISSEDPEHPIEGALGIEGHPGVGWRAAAPGKQMIRIRFDQPQNISRIQLVFDEPACTRSQEFVLAWSPDRGATFREIVRQQWNFSPHGAVTETEDYTVNLARVTVLQLTIDPDIGGGPAPASLALLRVG